VGDERFLRWNAVRDPNGTIATPGDQPPPAATRVIRSVVPARYVLEVSEDPITEELKLTQLEREQAERRRADSVPDEDEAAQHERRADKARYLADKLEERAESERRRDD
jgi:hypothetical protein